MKQVNIATEYITLGQFLKLAKIISSGGETRSFLETNEVQVDGLIDNHRGRKLYPGMNIHILDIDYVIVKK